jgi:hypothetical protein
MFSSTSGIQEAPALIPAGTLSKAVVVIRELKTSQKTGATYLDIELRLFDGKFEGRRIYDMIMNPFCPSASEGGKKMGILAITRICEAIGIFKVGDEKSYARYEGLGIDDVIRDIESQTVAIKVKIEPGQDGRADRNKVSEWLTPNPKAGSAHKGWNDLVNGVSNVAAAPTAFGAPSAAPTTASASEPSWLNKPN